MAHGTDDSVVVVTQIIVFIQFFKWIFHCCTHKQVWWCWGFGLVMHSSSALLKLSRCYIYQSYGGCWSADFAIVGKIF